MSIVSLLLVDDNEDFLYIFEKWFRHRGFLVSAVVTPDDALQTAESTKFDVAVVDMTLPGMNGLVLIERLKRTHDFQAIVLTGDDNPKLLKLASEQQIFSYLLKPVSLRVIEETILKSLERTPDHFASSQYQ